MKQIKIRSMDELKKALNKVPNSVLQYLEVALTDDGWGLSTCYTDKPNKQDDEWEWGAWFGRMTKKYPELQLVADYLQKVIDIVSSESDEDEDGIEVVLPKKKAKR